MKIATTFSDGTMLEIASTDYHHFGKTTVRFVRYSDAEPGIILLVDLDSEQEVHALANLLGQASVQLRDELKE